MAMEFAGREGEEWEAVEEMRGYYVHGGLTVTARFAVPGGWLYRVVDVVDGKVLATDMCFVPRLSDHQQD